jgi:hypothetical protein
MRWRGQRLAGRSGEGFEAWPESVAASGHQQGCGDIARNIARPSSELTVKTLGSCGALSGLLHLNQQAIGAQLQGVATTRWMERDDDAGRILQP